MSAEDRSVHPHLMTGLGRVQSKDDQVSERLCRKTISRHRVQMDYLLRVPEFEDLYQPGLEDLGLPLPRRGINLRSLLDSLLVEYKQQLAQWVIGQYRGRFPADRARRIIRIWALDGVAPVGDSLNFNEWMEFKERLLQRMRLEHSRYKKAQTILFRRYQSLLHKLVNRQVFDPGQRPDAYQEASLGLIHAIDKVEDSGASFGSYARTWITRQIRNYLMGERFPVHVPINLASRLLREGNEAQRRDENEVKDKRPSDPGATSKGDLSPFHELLHPGVPLDAPVSEDDQAPRQLADEYAVDPHERLSRKDLHIALRDLMSELTEKQREVLALRFGLNEGNRQWTLSEIAQEVGISHQQVSQREKRALEKLENVLRPLYDEMNAG